jgi:N-acetylglucosaminyldiphosphoundecaprenol N-acetyl-beta-D-mannosaminyltransferase
MMVRAIDRTFPVLGVRMNYLEIDAVASAILDAAHRRDSMRVSSLAVHGLVTARRNALFRAMVESFEILVPDGQPVRWLMNVTHELRLRRPVAGTDLMDELCARCASEQVRIYLYGSTEQVIESLQIRLLERYPTLQIGGAEHSTFRALSAEEDAALVNRINASGAQLIFLGLGCPRQEQFAHRHADGIRGVQICSGAAFEFLALTKRRAPRWMQECGLEWLHRLAREPRRLAWRYLSTNTLFIAYAIGEVFRPKLRGA